MPSGARWRPYYIVRGLNLWPLEIVESVSAASRGIEKDWDGAPPKTYRSRHVPGVVIEIERAWPIRHSTVVIFREMKGIFGGAIVGNISVEKVVVVGFLPCSQNVWPHRIAKTPGRSRAVRGSDGPKITL